MAKRKRLTLSPEPPATQAAAAGAPPRIRAPIASVTAEAAAASALREVTAEIDSLRREGRLVLRLPLGSVVEDHLLRDRISPEDAEFAGLVDSLRTHGQRTPIEVVDLGDGRHGLISGWRRLTALRRLAAEDAARFGSVLALPRRPETAADAYVAMVEENEVRSGLSYWERASIAARAVEAGVFPTEKIALQQLYASASRARRSKIGSFLTLYRMFEGLLRFPAALSERAGLALARAVAEDEGMVTRLYEMLIATPPDSAEAEAAVIAAAIAQGGSAGGADTSHEPPGSSLFAQDTPAPVLPPAPPGENSHEPAGSSRSAPKSGMAEDLGGGVFLRTRRGALELSGPGVTPDLAQALRGWLRARD